MARSPQPTRQTDSVALIHQHATRIEIVVAVGLATIMGALATLGHLDVRRIIGIPTTGALIAAIGVVAIIVGVIITMAAANDQVTR
ncbi:MAG TPA: hypothetical protein VFX16_04205 [Pseudonocardiaceae bacterium]|nr:hypothetical protein [Pseudonocardiaceae bacterium]